MSEDTILFKYFTHLDGIENKLEVFNNTIYAFLYKNKILNEELFRILTKNFLSKEFIQEFSLFISNIIYNNNSSYDNIFNKFNLQLFTNKNYIKDYYEIINKHVLNYKKNICGNNNLQKLDWQVAFIEKEKENLNLSCLEKTEISMKFTNDVDSNSNLEHQVNFKNSLIKLNYFEFSEIFDNLKKIETQLNAFKS